MSKDLITIAIPLYNETGPVEKVVDDTVALPLNKEIIVIDDGSTLPDALKILKRLQKKYPKILFLKNDPNIGKAASIKRAIGMAKGNVFVALDGDYEQDPKDIIKLYQTLQSSGASLVNGYRVITDPKYQHLYTSHFSRFSRFVMKVFTQILYGFSINDVLSGYKMFYTSMFRNHAFSSQRFGLETELIVETIRQGKRIVEIEVHYYPRTYKEGKKINVLDSIEILWVLLQKSTIYGSLRGFLVPAGLFVFACLLYSNTLRYYPTTDALPNTLAGLNIVQEGRIDLENYVPMLKEKGLLGITSSNAEGVHYPKTSPLFGAFSAPVIAGVNAWYGVGKLAPGPDFPMQYIYTLGKFVGIFYTALSAALLYSIIRRLYFSRIISLACVLTYIVATNVYNTAAQANWTHGVTLVCVNLFLLALVSWKHNRLQLIVLGLFAGFLASMRISTGFYALVPVCYIALSHYPRNETFHKLATYVGGCLLGYGLMLAGADALHVPGGYTDEIVFSLKIWTIPLFIQNLWALLFSFNFGLFTAFPVLLFALVKHRAFNIGKPLEMATYPTFILFIAFTASWWMWSGGYSNSARLLTDIMPLFAIYLASSLQQWKRERIFQVMFIATLLISIMSNIVTVYMADSSWHDRYTQPGHLKQNENAWFHSPTYFQYHLRKQSFVFTSIRGLDGTVMQHETVLRPSLKYKGIVKLFEGDRVLVQP